MLRCRVIPFEKLENFLGVDNAQWRTSGKIFVVSMSKLIVTSFEEKI